jgi:hypothetical protein
VTLVLSLRPIEAIVELVVRVEVVVPEVLQRGAVELLRVPLGSEIGDPAVRRICASSTESTTRVEITRFQSPAEAGMPSINTSTVSSGPPFIEKRLWFWPLVAVETPARTAMTLAVE